MNFFHIIAFSQTDLPQSRKAVYYTPLLKITANRIDAAATLKQGFPKKTRL